jgi:hypothetical protein
VNALKIDFFGLVTLPEQLTDLDPSRHPHSNC